MHAVCLTHVFERAAAEAGMEEEEVDDLVTLIAENPMVGDVIPGTNGCRKVRIAGRGKGKSGGYRTITFYSGDSCPVYLLTVFGKGEKANLNKRERNDLGKIAKAIVEVNSKKVAAVAAKRA